MVKPEKHITDRYQSLADTWGVENDSKEFWDKMKELGEVFQIGS